MRAKIMDFNKSSNGTIIKEEIKLPETLPVTADWIGDIIGMANNFEKKEDGIYCDIRIFNNDLLQKYGEGFPCIGISTDNSIDVKKDSNGTITVTKSELMQVSICSTTAYRGIKKLKQLVKKEDNK
jgi:hypothetical protein